MKKSLLISGLIGVIALTSCSSNLNTNNKTSNKETTSVLTTTASATTTTAANTTTTVTITSTDSIETTTITSKEKTDEEKREEVINKANAAIESLSDNNFTAKTGNDVYLIDGNNCIKNNIIYEKNTDNYNVYTLIDEEEQSYTKEETTDNSFAEISLGRWNNIFTIADEIMLNRATTESAYVVKKGFSVPEYEISYTTNGFIFSNENDSIEFYDIGKTEVNIPTNIVQEEYIIKDGKFNLTNLKAALTDWMNGNNAEGKNIPYAKFYRNLVEIKLINVTDEGLAFYATTVSKSNTVVLNRFRFKIDEINSINDYENLKKDDFIEILYNAKATDISNSNIITIDNSYSSSIVKRANWVLENDNINAEVIWAYENTGKSVLEGNGYNYDVVMFASNGKYYKYEVNCTNKIQSQDDYTGTKLEEVSVLEENLELYGFDILNDDKDQYIIKDGKYNLTNLKAVLEKWFNETDITYQKIGAHVEKVLLLDVNDKGLDIYTITNIDDGSCPVISNVSFKGEDINNIFLSKEDITSKDFVDLISSVTAKQITVHDGITIDNSSSSSIVRRANWVLENDNIDAEVIWAYENTGKSTLAGNGYGYNMVCFATDGKYYEYAVNCTDKASDKDDYTGTKTNEVSVLTENLELYGFDNLNDDKDQYIIKDGKYNLTNLKAVLEKWFNETDITYQKVFRNVKDIKLINVDNEGLKIYATTDVAEENNLALSILSFKGQDINDLFINKTELNADDFSLRLEKVTAKQLTFKSAGLVIDNSDTKESVCRRAENVLVKDGIDAKVIWAFETGKLNGNMTYGDGLTYKMACFCKDGNYYEYEVNALGKSYVENNITNKFDVEQKTKLSVLQENFDLYEEK